ncbi:MAG TPA: methyltransferase [Candidatus Acidoferrales bacterium]|jgi:ubiquinone/menaquinone biosynthesis C-methylase UbiE|nr:methyltransferase [Candidatus Acidoferrales bacterium]
MNSIPAASQTPTLDPAPLMQMSFSFAPSRILSTAVQLDIFSKIASGAQTVSEIAKAAGASERGTSMLLNALRGFELLTKHKDAFALSPLAAKFLVRDSPDYLGAMLEVDDHWEAWSKLPEAVRSGKPARSVFDPDQAERFFSVLTRSLHVQNRLPAQRLARILGAGSTSKGMRVLDIGCGSGVWGIAIAEADREARVTAQDLPKVLDQTRQYLERHGVAKQYDFLPGDLHTVELPAAKYDLILLGHIIHSESEGSARELFKRLQPALKPGGRLAIIDMIPNEERSGPPFPLIFALNMLVYTHEGGTYTFGEYKNWLTDAGFSGVELADFGDRSGVAAIIAKK